MFFYFQLLWGLIFGPEGRGEGQFQMCLAESMVYYIMLFYINSTLYNVQLIKSYDEPNLIQSGFEA